jgi:hypothetical protein
VAQWAYQWYGTESRSRFASRLDWGRQPIHINPWLWAHVTMNNWIFNAIGPTVTYCRRNSFKELSSVASVSAGTRSLLRSAHAPDCRRQGPSRRRIDGDRATVPFPSFRVFGSRPFLMFVTCTHLPTQIVSNPPMFLIKTEQFMVFLFARMILCENTKKEKRHDVHGTRPWRSRAFSYPTAFLFLMDSRTGPNGREINNGSKIQLARLEIFAVPRRRT